MIKRKLKIAVAVFAGLSGMGVLGGISYLQSERFANEVKRAISERSPQNFGVVGDFSNLELHLFPPGVGIANPKIRLNRQNVSKLPIEGDIEAKEMRVSFAPIQMLSGTLVLSEVAVIGGAVQGKLGAEVFRTSKKPKQKTKKLGWKDLFELQIESVRFEDTFMNVEAELPNQPDSPVRAEFVVKHLEVRKDTESDRVSFRSKGLINAVKIDIPKKLVNLPISEANQVQWNFVLNDEGLMLSPFKAEFAGTSVELDGTVTGNLLEGPNTLTLAGELGVHSDLGTFFLVNMNDDNFAGEASIKAKFQAALNDVVHTFKGSYEVSGTKLAWKTINADTLNASGELDLAHQKISLKNLLLTDGEGAQQGSIKIQDVALPLQMNEPFQAKIDFKNADLHWAGSAVLADIFALEGKLSGGANAQFIPGPKKTWSLKVQTDLDVARFALTNQSYKKSKPKTYILKPSLPLHLVGGLDISQKGLDFNGFKVKIQKSSFDVVGNVHGDTGFDFRATGPVDMAEIDQIAENPIRGTGTLSAHIHGPSSHVLLDFDPDLKEASYMNLRFGDLKGRVTYDDGIYELRMKNVHAKQGATFYSMPEGFIDLNGSDAIHLPFQIHSGKIEDMAVILEPLVKKISWFPKTLKGEIRGKVDLGGKIDTPRLEIAGFLEGSDWQWMGERARRVKLNLGYDKGLYYARNVSLIKTNGEIFGDIEFDSRTDNIKWNTGTNSLTLADIDFVDRLELPTKSKIEIKSVGDGNMSHIKSKTEGRFFATELKGEALEPTIFDFEVGESNLKASLQVFGKSLQAQLKYSLLTRQPSNFKMELNDFDFSPVLLILNPKLLDDTALKSRVNGKIQLEFLSDQFELARGEISMNHSSLQKTGFNFELVDPIQMPVQLGYFNLRPTRFRFKNGELSLSGEGRKGNLDLHLEGIADMAVAELVTPAIQKISGKANTEMRITGPLKDLKVNGDISFKNAYLLTRFIQTPFEEIDGTLHIRQGMIYVDSIESYLGDEVFSMSGRIETFADRFPILDLRAQFEDNKIKMLPLDIVQARGVATIKGTESPYTIGGNLDVLQALWTKSFGGNSALAIRGERFAPRDRDNQLGNSLFKLDLNINANQAFFVRNEIIDAEFKGKVRLIGPPDNPKLLGEGQLIQGKVLFRDRPFVFESVRIEFDDPYQMNPKFNAAAVSEINQYKVRVLAFGRSNSWKAEFSSSPFLPENEIYSLLASGLTTTDNSRFRSRDRTYVNQGEAASLILHSLDFSKDVQSKTGLQFDVEEAVDVQSANSIFSPQSVGTNVAAPKVVLKRSLGNKVGLSFGSTVGVGSQNQREVNAEYKLTRGMSFLGVWTNIEEINTRETRTSYGVDVKFNKKFK